MKKQTGNRILSLLLMLVLLATMVPIMAPQVSAAGEQWLWPIEGVYKISSNYGYRDLDGNGSLEDEHEGIDISTSQGTPIRAAKSGTVYESVSKYGADQFVSSGYGTFGNHVRIDHGDGTYSMYLHMIPTGVKAKGSVVKQGDIIGYVGNSGHSYGNHLHFQIFTNKDKSQTSTLNPMPTNSEITVKNTYKLPSGWPTQKTTYIFSPGMTVKTKTIYPSHISIITNRETYVKTLPCSRESDANSDDIEIAKKGTTYEVVALHANTWDNLWYQVISKKDGSRGFIYGEHADFKEQILNADDISITDYNVPKDHTKGKSFVIKGKLQTKYQVFSKITASVTDSAGKITSSSANVNVSYYSLQGSSIDNGLAFGKLAAGKHNYTVTVTVRSYYVTGSKTYDYIDRSFQILGSSFDVHEFTSKVTTAPTCTAAGVKTFSCTACDKQYTESIAATGHSYDKTTIISPTCVEPGLVQYTCSKCSEYYTESISNLGHSFGDWVVSSEQSCTEAGVQYRTCSTCGELDIISADALGHDYVCEVTEEPTPRTSGRLTGQCTRCGEPVDVVLPALNDSDYTASQGFYVWNNTTYGTYRFEIKLGYAEHILSGVITSFMDETEEVTIELINAANEIAYSTTVTGCGAEYSIENVAPGTYTMRVSKANHVTRSYTVTVEEDTELDVAIYPIGDVTCDGEVSGKDCAALLSHVKGIKLITDEHLLLGADVTGDGEVSGKDCAALLSHVKGIKLLF